MLEIKKNQPILTPLPANTLFTGLFAGLSLFADLFLDDPYHHFLKN